MVFDKVLFSCYAFEFHWYIHWWWLYICEIMHYFLENIIAHLNCFEISHMLIFIYVLTYTCDQYALWHVKRKCVFVIPATDMQDKICNKRDNFDLRSIKCYIKPKFVGKQCFNIFDIHKRLITIHHMITIILLTLVQMYFYKNTGCITKDEVHKMQ